MIKIYLWYQKKKYRSSFIFLYLFLIILFLKFIFTFKAKILSVFLIIIFLIYYSTFIKYFLRNNFFIFIICLIKGYLVNAGGATVDKLMQDGHVYCVVVEYGLKRIKKWRFIIMMILIAWNHLVMDLMFKCMAAYVAHLNGFRITQELCKQSLNEILSFYNLLF